MPAGHAAPSFLLRRVLHVSAALDDESYRRVRESRMPDRFDTELHDSSCDRGWGEREVMIVLAGDIAEAEAARRNDLVTASRHLT